jgi:hypothetical protein
MQCLSTGRWYRKCERRLVTSHCCTLSSHTVFRHGERWLSQSLAMMPRLLGGSSDLTQFNLLSCPSNDYCRPIDVRQYFELVPRTFELLFYRFLSPPSSVHFSECSLQFAQFAANSSDGKLPLNTYMQSVGIYSLAFMALAAALAGLYLWFFIARFAICYKSGGICGKRHPTPITWKFYKCGCDSQQSC